MSAAEALVLRKGEGTTYRARASEMVFKINGDSSGGQLSLMERGLPPGGTPPLPHVHAGYEAFYVLEGEIEFRLGPRVESTRDGDFVLVPPGAPHTFANVSADPARLLILHAPAADAYFAELDELWSRAEPDPEAQAALMRRHGIEPVSPT
jgi:quercetin dioxygenase-like cupin family protein